MIRVYILVFIIAAFFWLKAFLRKPLDERDHYLKISALYAVALSLLVLVMMGHLNWVIAALSVAIAFMSRFLPVLLRYAPQLQRLWFMFRESNASVTGNPGSGNYAGLMTAKQAYKVLGLSLSASRQEIIEAHRKLMLKNHPDRGGSSYIAAQINRAKEILLKNK